MFKKIMIAAAVLAMAMPGAALAQPKPVVPAGDPGPLPAGIGAQAVDGPFNLRIGFAPHRNLEVIRNEVSSNGGRIRQWGNDGSPEQKWFFFEDRTIRPLLDTSMCLDGDPRENWDGGRVYVWKCNNSAQQKWLPGINNTLSNDFSLRCLDANPNENHNGGRIYQWRCHGGTPQQWTRVRV